MTDCTPNWQIATESSSARDLRLNIAIALAAQVDSARHLPLLQQPLLNWHEGDAIAHLLDELAAVLSDEPIAELACELAEQLRIRLGPMPGYDPKKMLDAVLVNVERRLNLDAPSDAS
ncbi:hypothetical protein GCM10027187_18250 [Streptosporangium sandarakinum]|uniref:Uncharacterized protein n=1 Tax=Streptosporangium sandarakinum TaxID=1260955 RepID=A0A852UZ29_9ACTN|nr:hypothetical protein [Streptosporangium sandarakinum]NYF42917.1 hypothetical protein [Streptosporangium sandarakinum]